VVHAIYADLQAAQNPSHRGRGIARYSVECVTALARAGLPIAGVATSPYHPPVELPAELTTRTRVVTRSAHAMRALVGADPFTYLLTSPMELDLTPSRTLSRAALTSALSVVAVLYDLIPLLFPDRYLVSPRSRATYDARLGLLRELDLVLAISEHTRLDAIEHLGLAPERVSVIGGGASEHFRPPAQPDEPWNAIAREHPEVRAPFVLTVAAWEWRKNLETLVRAFAAIDPALRHRRQLVVVCSGMPPGSRTWHDAASAAGLADDEFVVVGPVSDHLLRALYQACELFVFPSRYEGYGLPVVEAARCGAPVVTSSASALPEILDLPASTFPPDDVAAMAGVVERGIVDETFRAELAAAGARVAATHTWDAVGSRARDAWARLDGRPTAGSCTRSVAYVGRSNGRTCTLLRGLHPRATVDVFEPDPTGRPERAGDAVYPLVALERLLDPLDYDVLVWSSAECPSDPRPALIAADHPAAVDVGDGTERSVLALMSAIVSDQVIRSGPVA
jgi:glycosyltransferase involved in cell wall biosynthesis